MTALSAEDFFEHCPYFRMTLLMGHRTSELKNPSKWVM
jgi:hypothetical protein